MLDHFVHECPVCGRPLRISAAYAGHPVTCCHCRGRFVVAVSAINGDPLTTQENSLLRRANHLLEMVGRRLGTVGGSQRQHGSSGLPLNTLTGTSVP
jgi:hypothetical protein